MEWMRVAGGDKAHESNMEIHVHSANLETLATDVRLIRFSVLIFFFCLHYLKFLYNFLSIFVKLLS